MSDSPDSAPEAPVRAAIEALGLECELLDCDPEFADTAAFCERYGIDPEDSANAIIVASKRPSGRLACCLVLATSRLDVNKKVCKRLEVKRASFLDAEGTRELTGQMIGGVTVLGLPADLPILVDSRVMTRERIVVGGGSRSLKLRMSPDQLRVIPNVEVLDLARNSD